MFGTPNTVCVFCPTSRSDVVGYRVFGMPNIVDDETSSDCDMLHECVSRLRFEADAAAPDADKLRP